MMTTREKEIEQQLEGSKTSWRGGIETILSGL